MNLEQFNKILFETKDGVERQRFVRKYLLSGTPEVFKNREEDYFEFRERISTNFGINYYDIIIVGSARLGFSYHKKSSFSLDSDVDVAIISPELYEKYFKVICDYQYEIEKKAASSQELDKYFTFLKYVVKGWIRPDFLPESLVPGKLKDDWFDYFRSISYDKSEVGNYEVNAGLFKDYSYAEKYYLKSVEEHFNKLKVGR